MHKSRMRLLSLTLALGMSVMAGAFDGDCRP